MRSFRGLQGRPPLAFEVGWRVALCLSEASPRSQEPSSCKQSRAGGRSEPHAPPRNAGWLQQSANPRWGGLARSWPASQILASQAAEGSISLCSRGGSGARRRECCVPVASNCTSAGMHAFAQLMAGRVFLSRASGWDCSRCLQGSSPTRGHANHGGHLPMAPSDEPPSGAALATLCHTWASGKPHKRRGHRAARWPSQRI